MRAHRFRDDVMTRWPSVISWEAPQAVLSGFGSVAGSLVWISGASGGIGRALVQTIP